MNIDITRLKNSLESSIAVDTKIEFAENDVKDADILKMEPVNVKGKISKTSLDDYLVVLEVSGKMFLPCALTLKPVEYPFNINIEEVFSENADEMSKKIKNFENTIDILPIVWENILMEIPMRVVSPDASLENIEGDGWKLVTDERENVNPELVKLKDLFDEKEV